MRSSWKQSSRTLASVSLGISGPEINNASQSSLGFDRRASDPVGYNDDAIVRHAVSAAMKGCALSREQIAEQMTALLGVRVTEKMLNSYSAESGQAHRWPAAWDRAFSRVTGDDTLLVCRVIAAGLRVITPDECALLELGRELLRQQRASEKIALLEKRLSGVDL